MSVKRPYGKIELLYPMGEEMKQDTVYIQGPQDEVEKQINDWCVGRASLIAYTDTTTTNRRIFGPVHGTRAIINLSMVMEAVA